jgi:hypothetical protein
MQPDGKVYIARTLQAYRDVPTNASWLVSGCAVLLKISEGKPNLSAVA